MASVKLPRVLCVDDEPAVLDGIRVTLRKRYQVLSARSGAAGLRILRDEESIATVLSDMQMPAMDGVVFLTKAREIAPNTVRMLLTGVSDLNSAIHVVNDGQIFRFLTKPCPPKHLLNAFKAAVQQHRLIASERVLLEETLRGCVRTLTHLLSIANPAAFGRASRVRRYVRQLARHLHADAIWEIEVGAMLSQIGSVTLPDETAEKLYFGKPLESREAALVARLPEIAAGLVGEIPRLENVRAMVALQSRRFDGAGPTHDDLSGEQIPLGARLIKIALDYDELEAHGIDTDRRIELMRSRTGEYDPRGLDALEQLHARSFRSTRTRELVLTAIRAGMVLEEDILTTEGRLLIARGNEVTPQLLEHLENLSPQRVREPIRVGIPEIE